MKLSLRIILTLCITSSLIGRELGTPLPFQRGPYHLIYSELQHDCWFFNFWTGYYNRSADCALNCNGKETPLTTLYFNKAQFNAQEAFPASTATDPFNPLLQTSILGPRVTWRESGVTLGTVWQGYVSENCRIGFRANIPLKKIHIRRQSSCGNGSSDLGGQAIRDVAATRNEVIDGVTIPNSYAYRLDFLSRLPYTCEDCPARAFLIVDYSDTDFPPQNVITMSNQDVTNLNNTPISLIENVNGTIPDGPFAVPQAEANQLRILNSTGTNSANNQRTRFASDVNYTPLGGDPNQQAIFFVVPTVADGRKVPAARVIQQHVQELLACIDPDAETIFKNCGVNFGSQCVKGKGDLDTEVFVGYFFNPCFYGEAFGGIRWPTGKRQENSFLVFKPALGNNGHYEFSLGAQALWQAHSYLSVKGDLSWHAVQRGEECVAAAFQGAQVKNIGVAIPAQIAWDYTVFHLDLLLTPRYNMGIDLGYELYNKTHDTVDFCTSLAKDCLGVTALLNSSVISKNTDVTSHKIRGDVFWFCDWFEFYGGGSTVFAGKNVPKQSDWHVGFTVYF